MSEENKSTSAALAAFDRYTSGSISASIVNYPGYREYFITLDLMGLEDIGQSLKDLFAYLDKEKAKVIQQIVFGDCLSKKSFIKKMQEFSLEVNWPIMALENDSEKYSPLSSMQFIAISGVELEELRLKDKVVGYSFEDKDAKYAYLCDVRPVDIIKSQKEQTKEVYKRVTQALSQADMDFSNVIRTWFYLDRLLTWYGVFNEARTGYFNDNKVFQNLVPASTGIGVRNKEGSALATGFYAVKPKNETISISRIESPMQCEAFNYKSAFSRAVELKVGKVRKLIISGTASISPDGKSVNMGYINKQIELTMEIVKKLLTSRSMDWSNVTRAIVYFKESDGGLIYKEYCRVNKIPDFPTAMSYSSVCRDELLFEIELDAAANT